MSNREPKPGVIILGSARGDGNTAKIAEFLAAHTQFSVVDLLAYDFGQYDYQHRNQGDDFADLLEGLMDYPVWIFATPVYWYSMSGTMKKFFDRMTDLLDLHPKAKMALAGMHLGLVCCSSDAEPIPHFELPFRETAIYMSMSWLGHRHTWVEEGQIPERVVQELVEFAGVARAAIAK
ncbi:MAG: NAD(P)H-dependent oxidoreductase [Bacteroidota bacterium]